MWRRWLLRFRRVRASRERRLTFGEPGPSAGMPWFVRLRMFLTGQGAIDHREDLRGRWLLHRKVLILIVASLLAWFIAQAAAGWHFLEG